MPYRLLLDRVHDAALQFLDRLPDRPVTATATFAELRARLGGVWCDAPQDPDAVIASLLRDAEPGVVSTAGPRYFGFVTGGSLPVAVAAEWMLSAWDQNGALHVMSPAASALEDIAASWVLDALSLPRTASVGFVTGAHMANVTALVAARHEVLRREGWDVEARGLQGAPPLTVFASTEAHTSIGAACRFVGVGADTIVRIPADAQGRLLPGAAGGSDGSRVRRADRLRAGGETSTPARAIRSPRSSTSRTSGMPGCTSTARSGCGPRRCRCARTSSTASSGRIRGPPTATSG